MLHRLVELRLATRPQSGYQRCVCVLSPPRRPKGLRRRAIKYALVAVAPRATLTSRLFTAVGGKLGACALVRTFYELKSILAKKQA